MSFGQFGHFGPSQSGEGREDKEIPGVAQPVGGKIDCHHFGKLLTCQVSVKCRGDLKLVTGERIA